MRLLLIFLSILLLVSCEDIVNSDKNIRITEIKYKSIKEDQENGVILPLKVGNKWHYDVTEFSVDAIKQAEYIDSIHVINETVISGERWFEVYFPVLSEGNIYMTNTDVGLWVKCDDCENQSFLLAKYPDHQDIFASGFTDIRNLPINDPNNYDELTDLLISKKTITENLSVPKGDFDCIKYTSRFESDEIAISQFPIMEEYYSEDVGLIKAIHHQLLSDNICKVFELRDEPINDDNCLEQINIPVGDIQNGLDHNESIDIENNTAIRLSVTDIQIEYIGLQNIATLSEPFATSLPITIVRGEKATMDITLSPQQTGRFTIIIKVISTIGCLYEITLEGRSV
jgi:hypothetical protein